jgi:hypothetical protein
MNGTANERGVAVLSGNGARRLSDKKDLVALHAPIEMDWLSRFMRNYLWIFFVVCSAIQSSKGSFLTKTRF